MSQARCLGLTLVKIADCHVVDSITGIDVDSDMFSHKSGTIGFGCTATGLVGDNFIEHRLLNTYNMAYVY